MGAIENLCANTILLQNGMIERIGITSDVISKYLQENRHDTGEDLGSCLRKGNGKLRLTSFHFESTDKKNIPYLRSGEPAVLVLDFENSGLLPEDRVSFSFAVHNEKELGLFHNYSLFSGTYFSDLPNQGQVKCKVDEIILSPGDYLMSFYTIMNGDLKTGDLVDWPQILIPFRVEAGDFFHTGSTNLSTWAPILIRGNWSLEI